MYCKKCGEEVKDDSRFCRKCGATIVEEGMSVSEEFYIVEEDEKRGPFSPVELENLYQEGNLEEQTLIWKEGMDQWKTANEIEEIQKIFERGKRIKCEVCGQEYYEKEEECPHCKARDEKEKKIRNIKKTAPIIVASLAVISIIVFGVVFYFSNFHLTKEERTEVEETMEAISLLGTIDENSEYKILQAEILYAKLLPKSQKHVNNIEILRAAREEYNNIRAQEVVNRISEIGVVSKESGDQIAEIEMSYQQLLDSQKRRVENADTLMNARKEYDQLCAQEVINEIEAIGAITFEKRTLIENAWNSYCALTEEQKLLVTNSEFLEKAEEEIRIKLADIEEAKNTVTGVMDAFKYELSADQIFTLVENSNVFDYGIREMLSKGFLSNMIIEGMTGDVISYADLNYLSKSTLDLLEAKVVEEFVNSYSIKEPQFIDERIVIDVDVKSYYGGISHNMIEAMADDLLRYINNNKTTVGYMKRYYSDAEFYKNLLDMYITSYGSTWLRDMDSWRFYAESKHVDWRFTLSKDTGEWKITHIEIMIGDI